MSYFLRVEGVNLGSFVFDTNDLSTVRGGGLILLNALKSVADIVQETHPILSNDLSSEIAQSEAEIKRLQVDIKQHKQGCRPWKKKNKVLVEKRQEKNKLIEQKQSSKTAPKTKSTFNPTITRGASWGLFELKCNADQAKNITQKVQVYLNEEQRQYATFVVSLYKADQAEDYVTSRAKAQTLNRWQQLKNLTQYIPEPNESVCSYDKVSPAPLNNDRHSAKQQNQNISDSVKARREYGRDKKQALYQDIANFDHAFASDFDEICKAQHQGILNGKMAFIYIDGNSFGARQKESRNPDAQRDFDVKTREGRQALFKQILNEIVTDEEWLTSDVEDPKLRLETLLWGGDEIIWVVPAWKGWWLIQRFYELVNEHMQMQPSLYHGAGLVFCHHTAPIKSIESLARELADNFAKKTDFKQKNKVAYEILKSFDRADARLDQYRQAQLGEIGQVDDMLVDAEKISVIISNIEKMKRLDFPRGKVYQILSAARSGDTDSVKKAEDKLRENHPEVCVYLDELLECLANENSPYIAWHHIANFWDYC